MKKTILTHLLTFLYLSSILIPAMAQVDQNQIDKDPLMKPRIWNKLEHDPENVQLWEVYFNKQLFDFTEKESQLFEQMKIYLHNKLEKSLIGNQKNLKNKKKNIDQDFQRLVQNPIKNFYLIEQYFEKKLQSIGEQYHYYHEFYPHDEYSKILWVEENEKKLIKNRSNKNQ